jgi:phosphotransacetylase
MDTAHFGSSSLAAEEVDVVLTGAVPAFAKHSRSLMAACRERRT